VFSLTIELVGCEELTKGVFYQRGAPEQDVWRQGSSLNIQRQWGTLQGSAHDKVGSNGCGTEHRRPTPGRWSSRSITHVVMMKGVNLGFVSVFFEIPAQLPSIYSGFGLIISCACRALSPCSQIQLGFDISFDFIEILAGDVSISVMRVSEAGADSARSNSAHGEINIGESLLNFQIFSMFPTNLNSIQI
jgi:hypothetical protein